jgi:hypothetical protein
MSCGARSHGVAFHHTGAKGTGMTLDEVRGRPELALWSGNRDEFLFNPDSGVVWWRPCGSVEVTHGDSWHTVPAGKIVPHDGWAHRLDCECPLCR